MTNEIPSSLSNLDESVTGKHELTNPKTFKYSWLDPDTQTILVSEITREAREALSCSIQPVHLLFIVNLLRPYERAINVPFALVRDKPRELPGYNDVSAPFEPRLACAIAFLNQEKFILLRQTFPSDEVRSMFNMLGVVSIPALGQGIARLSGQINAWRKDKPSWSTLKVIQEVIERSRLQLEKEIRDYEGRYVYGHRHFGYDKDSTVFFTWKSAEDQLKGFNQGYLLLNELLEYNWEI